MGNMLGYLTSGEVVHDTLYGGWWRRSLTTTNKGLVAKRSKGACMHHRQIAQIVHAHHKRILVSQHVLREEVSEGDEVMKMSSLWVLVLWDEGLCDWPQVAWYWRSLARQGQCKAHYVAGVANGEEGA
jgi:hypothetical protein